MMSCMLQLRFFSLAKESIGPSGKRISENFSFLVDSDVDFTFYAD